ncbi:MAG TPA: hypothetical protein VKA12_07060 [Roseiarcus sp.]|nr:hypothetical protein [Roseiarcus sp.]
MKRPCVYVIGEPPQWNTLRRRHLGRHRRAAEHRAGAIKGY